MIAAKPRVVFFGNSEGVFSNRHYRALTQSAGRIVAVVDTPAARRTSTNPAKGEYEPFTKAAAKTKIPVFAPENPNDPGFVETIKGIKPDLFLAVGYIKIMKSELLAAPRIMAANFHASLLPAYRGKHPVFWALRNGEKSVGLTVHVMDARLDTGGILYQVRIRTRRKDTVAGLYDRIMRKSVGLIPRLVADAGHGRLRPRLQPRRGASYFSSATEGDFRLDWKEEAATLCRRICATPGKCFFDWEKKRVFVNDAEWMTGQSRAKPGTLIRVGRQACWMATGKGVLKLVSATVTPGRRETMATFCAHNRIAAGQRL